MENQLLNVGCHIWKIPGFINIDIDPKVKPDLVLDLKKLNQTFNTESVDFIYASHILEHFSHEDSLEVAKQCKQILKRFRCMLAVVPDWRKAAQESDENAERIIMANGDHKTLMTSNRLKTMLLSAGFKIVQEIHDLKQVPYMLVPDIKNPQPETWQTAIIAMKTV